MIMQMKEIFPTLNDWKNVYVIYFYDNFGKDRVVPEDPK